MKEKLLIVYYSVSNGNTKRIAEQLQKATGADVVQIETITPYVGSYNDIVEQGQREVDAHYRPAIKPLAVNPLDYDTIVIGTPTWWYTVAPAVLTFLHSFDWSGKTIVPFQTHGGWKGHVMKDVKNICKGARFALEKDIRFDSTGGATLITEKSDIEEWIQKVKTLQKGE